MEMTRSQRADIFQPPILTVQIESQMDTEFYYTLINNISDNSSTYGIRLMIETQLYNDCLHNDYKIFTLLYPTPKL